jgi:phage shock protein PspC (stress-responsive transcriptional regulator)
MRCTPALPGPDPGYACVVTTSQLVRPRDGKWIAGVCAGLADRFGISRGLVRLVFVIFGLVGAGELAYIILWFLIPKA